MKHEFSVDKNGEIEHFDMGYNNHYGVYCLRCQRNFCERCVGRLDEEECSSLKLELFTLEEII